MGKINKKENGNFGKKAVGGNFKGKNFNNKPGKDFPKKETGKIVKQKNKVKKNIGPATIPKEVKNDFLKNKKQFEKKPNLVMQNKSPQNGGVPIKKEKPGKGKPQEQKTPSPQKQNKVKPGKGKPQTPEQNSSQNKNKQQKKEKFQKHAVSKENQNQQKKKSEKRSVENDENGKADKTPQIKKPKVKKPKSAEKLQKLAERRAATEKKQKALENAPPFNEETFNKLITREKVRKVCDALAKQLKEESKTKKKVFSDFTYLLTVSAFKVPNCPKRMVKLKLEHPLVDENDDVCFIVRDIKRGLKIDYEPTIEKAEELLKELGINTIKAILPFNKIKKEYNTHEMKKKLSNLYDAYLCDGAVVGHVVGFLGKRFMKSRCAPIPVRMNTDDLAREINTALKKTAYKQGMKGNLISITIGTSKMTSQQLADNIVSLIPQFKALYPGGLENIRNMYLRINIAETSALPLFISTCKPPAKTPYIVGPKEEKLVKTKKDAEKVLENFKLTKEAKVMKAGQKRSQETAEIVNNKKEKSAKKQKLVAKNSLPTGKGIKGAAAAKETGKKLKNVKPEPESEDDSDDDDPTFEDEETFKRQFLAVGKDEDESDDDSIDDDDDDDDNEEDDDEDEDDDDEDDDDIGDYVEHNDDDDDSDSDEST